MKGKIVILLALFLSAFAVLPDRIINGKVTFNNQPVAGALISMEGSKATSTTDQQGEFTISVPHFTKILKVTAAGFKAQQIALTSASFLNIVLEKPAFDLKKEPRLVGTYEQAPKKVTNQFAGMSAPAPAAYSMRQSSPLFDQLTVSYKAIDENGFQVTSQQAVTTFAADVDRASYSNIRRYLNQGSLPPADAVRIEEMINYFDYNYPQPKGDAPIALTTELTDSPWNTGLKLLHIGMQAKKVSVENLPPSNLVFLVDVSGSMNAENKLPLVKEALKLLVNQLREQDKISIVAYAGAAGIILPPTPGNEKSKIKAALEKLEAGGSTAGGEGIELAYDLAAEHFITKGNNRVILATDGDFNVGISTEAGLQRLIEQKRKSGIYLSVMGFGMGNYKDNVAETLADKGNGNYAYIDNIQEARKEFVHEFGGTLFTVAKDVKIQIEFNPAHVQAYRLIGYENRALKNEEFHDDKKDAGEMGSGHIVTAIYELIPAGFKSSYLPKTDPLKYQKNNISADGKTDELLTIKVRYKEPDSEKSKLFDLPVGNSSRPFASCSENLRFSAAVAEFGLLLRDSEFKGEASYADVISKAQNASGKDNEGYRTEFVQLVKTARSLQDTRETASRK
ncbi:YfbK domain-containing protein [Dyadobacter crusticola]|uniref:YfbK domain-containing protein n=1 Tax=Dyadobacter crusticola TaxID=292407 RepID=UPI0004E2868E|nr:von Willebrand factor type A domain-containing protein [Dyadobacter crusticola]